MRKQDQYYWRASLKSAYELELHGIETKIMRYIKRASIKNWAFELINDDRKNLKRN